MAVTTGNEYDHIDISTGSGITRHMLKDAQARADKVDKNGVGQVTADNLADLVKTQRVIISDNLFERAELLSTGKYADIGGQSYKLVLRDNSAYDTYIIPVDGSIYKMTPSMRTVVLLEEDRETPVGTTISNTAQVDTVGASYMAFSFYNTRTDVTIKKTVPVYKVPVNWELEERTKSNIASISGSLANGESLSIAGRSAIKDGELIIFKAKLTSFESLRLNFTTGTTVTNYIDIDGPNITINNGFSFSPVAHELTIENDICLTVQFVNGHAKVSIYSNGESYTRDVEWKQQNGTCSQPEIVSTNTDAIDATLKIVYQALKRKIWIFGDSYLGVGSDSRWPYYLSEDGYDKTSMLNGSAGMTSGGNMISFRTLIQYGTPKFAVFAAGMNDGSGAGTTYVDNRTAFLELCAENDITPILCTIPTVPTVDNEAKNAWVRSSGYRYIDLDEAVGADSNGEWYDGMLSTDNVHPTAKGAKALYTQVLIDFPEIADI